MLVDEFGAPTKEGWRKIGQLFQTPMATRERNGPGGRSFAYVTARQVADRLDKVIGPGNWATSFRVLSVEDHVVECTLSVFGISKADVGYSNNPDSENESEPLKAAYSDALKRAAVQWESGDGCTGTHSGRARNASVRGDCAHMRCGGARGHARRVVRAA